MEPGSEPQVYEMLIPRLILLEVEVAIIQHGRSSQRPVITIDSDMLVIDTGQSPASVNLLVVLRYRL